MLLKIAIKYQYHIDVWNSERFYTSGILVPPQPPPIPCMIKIIIILFFSSSSPAVQIFDKSFLNPLSFQQLLLFQRIFIVIRFGKIASYIHKYFVKIWLEFGLIYLMLARAFSTFSVTKPNLQSGKIVTRFFCCEGFLYFGFFKQL